MISQPVSERDWQAEDDARILAESKVIQADKARLDKAIQAANRIVEERKKEMSAMQSVANKRSLLKEQENNQSKASPSPVQSSKKQSKRTVQSSSMNVFQKI